MRCWKKDWLTKLFNIRKMVKVITDLQRQENEDFTAWKIRCCLAKRRKETDMDWSEIRDMLGLDVNVDHLRKIALGYDEYDEYINGYGNVGTTILSISDTHYPFAKPINTFAAYSGKVDILQINGDALDCSQLSKFPKTFHISPLDEIIGGRQYIIDLINMIKPKKVIVNHGNHDLRMGQYIANKIDNELQELMPVTAFDYIFTDGFTHYDRKSGASIKYDPICKIFDDVDIEYSGTWYSQYNDIIFCHPKTFSSSPLKTAERALTWFRNEGFSPKALVMAHTHRVGSYKIGNCMTYEQGCCCETKKMRYNDGQLVNSQKEGFIFICLDKDGNLMEEKTKLVTLN